MAVKRILIVIILTQLTFNFVNSGGDSFPPFNSVFDTMRNDTYVDIKLKIKQPELVDSTLDDVSLNFTTETQQITRTIPRVKFIQTSATTANILFDKSLEDCLYDEDSGDLLSRSGNCDHSCVDGKVIEIFLIGGKMFCCCKRSVADTTLINLTTMESSFEKTKLSSTETFNEDTTMTATEIYILPSITTANPIISPENQSIKDCIYNAQSGELTSASGSCYDSCQNNKVLNTFYINDILLCCCKPAQNKTEEILPQDMPLEDCVFDPISNEVTNFGGDCYESCADGKFIAMFQVSKKITLCCCK